MTRRVRWDRREDRGSAVLEFLVVAVVLSVPFAFAAAALLQAAVLRATARNAAETAALTIARGASSTAAPRLVAQSWHQVPPSLATDVACRPDCTAPGAVVTVRVAVAVPLVPGLTLRQSADQVVDRYGGQ